MLVVPSMFSPPDEAGHVSSQRGIFTILPTLAGILYAGSLWLSNSSYLFLSVSFIQMTKSLMPGLVYASGVMLATEKFSMGVTLNMLLIAFGVVICALGEMNLVLKGLIQQLAALGFEVRPIMPCGCLHIHMGAPCMHVTLLSEEAHASLMRHTLPSACHCPLFEGKKFTPSLACVEFAP